MSKSSLYAFRWSQQEYTLKELIDDYKHLLPFVILVTQGFSEQNDRVSASSNEVYWLHDIIKEKWVILRDSRGKKYKVSAEYDAMVIPVNANGAEGKPMPFSQVLLREDCKFLRFCDPDRDVLGENRSRQPVTLTELRVMEKQEKEALVVHSIFTDDVAEYDMLLPSIRNLPQGVVHPEFSLLPSDLPITVSLGVSMNSANPDTMFFYIMSDIKLLTDSYPHDYLAYMRRNAELERYNPEERQMVPHPGNRKGKQKIPVKMRTEPVALKKDIDPHHRLKELRQFYDGKSSVNIRESGRGGQPSQNRYTTIALMLARPDMEEVEEDEATLSCRATVVAEDRAGSRRTVLPPSGQRTAGIRDARQRASVAQCGLGMRERSGSARDEGRLSAVPERAASSRTLAELPKDINDFGLDEVSELLQLLRLDDNDACALKVRPMDGRQLAKLPEERLRKEFGLSSSGARKLAEFVRSRMTISTGFDLDTVRRKLPENAYITLYES